MVSPKVRREGFTLIEMMVTIGIIIIAAGFLVPSLAKMFQSRALESAGKLIVSTVREARQEAVTSKTAHRVIFLQNGLQIYKEPRKDQGGKFLGAIKPYAPKKAGTIRYNLWFAGKTYEAINEEMTDISEGIMEGDISLRFLPDGTIDFGDHTDIYYREGASVKSDPDNPPADITIEQEGDPYNRGLIDIRPWGGDAIFKIKEIDDVED